MSSHSKHLFSYLPISESCPICHLPKIVVLDLNSRQPKIIPHEGGEWFNKLWLATPGKKCKGSLASIESEKAQSLARRYAAIFITSFDEQPQAPAH
jgi:hypothetical protein